MNKELMEALNILEKEKEISKETLFEAIENSLLTACNGDTHIYKTTYKGVTITFYLSGIGSAVASDRKSVV